MQDPDRQQNLSDSSVSKWCFHYYPILTLQQDVSKQHHRLPCLCVYHTWFPHMPFLLEVVPAYPLPSLCPSSVLAHLKEEKSFFFSYLKSQSFSLPQPCSLQALLIQAQP